MKCCCVGGAVLQYEDLRFEAEVRRRMGQDPSDLITPEIRKHLMHERAQLVTRLNRILDRQATRQHSD